MGENEERVQSEAGLSQGPGLVNPLERRLRRNNEKVKYNDLVSVLALTVHSLE